MDKLKMKKILNKSIRGQNNGKNMILKINDNDLDNDDEENNDKKE